MNLITIQLIWKLSLHRQVVVLLENLKGQLLVQYFDLRGEHVSNEVKSFEWREDLHLLGILVLLYIFEIKDVIN